MLPKYFYLFISCFGGALYALGFPSDIITFASPIFSILGILLWSLPSVFENKFSLKFNLSNSLAFSLGYFIMGYHWIPYTISEFGGIHFPFNYMLGVLSALILMPHLLIFNILHKFLKQYFWFNQSITYAFLLTFIEYYGPQQFPAHLGQSWLSVAPYLSLSEIFGSPGYSFISYWLAISLAKFIFERKIDYLLIPITLAFLSFNFLNPIENYKQNRKQQNSKSTQLRLVQGNIGNYLKVSSEDGDYVSLAKVLNNFKELSLMDSKEKIDLLVWPETSFPQLLSSDSLYIGRRYTPQLFTETVTSAKAKLLVGGYDQLSASEPGLKNNPLFFETEYNTAFFFDETGMIKNHYHKMKLIPFGESLPFGPLNEYLSSIIDNVSFFAKGKKHTLFKYMKDKYEIRFITAICYEILFSRFIRNYLNNLDEQPDFIINLTNDSWYGDTIEPYQHQYLARFRAIEFNLPIVRVTNTGITSILYPDGSLSKQLLPFTRNILDVKLFVPHENQKTTFQQFGFLVVLTLGFLLLVFETVLKKLMQGDKSLK